MRFLGNILFKLSRHFGSFRIAKYMTRKQPKIFMYHRVKDGTNGEGLEIDIFKKQMKIIHDSFHPMTLGKLMREVTLGTAPKNAVVVTFDDGYKDFANLAYPILADLKIPVTLFVTTGFINCETWLWPDKIRYALNKTKKDQFKISGFDEVLRIRNGINECWRIIADYCLTISTEEKNRLIDELFRAAEVDCPTQPPEKYMPLSWAQLKHYLEDGNEIGSHTVNHPILTKLDSSELRYEVNKSKSDLYKNLGINALSFCYPNGTTEDYSTEVQYLVELAGYQYAVTAMPSPFDYSKPFEIGRYGVGNSMDNFEKNIYGFTSIAERCFRSRGTR